MDQAKQFMEESSGVNSYQTIWDVISDYTMYVLFLVGVFVSVMIFSHGGDIMLCNPVIKCPSTSAAYLRSSTIQPTVRNKCEAYKNASSAHFNKSSFVLVLHLLSINQYKYTNSYCSESLLGIARFTYPSIFAVAILLFCLGRLWYVLPTVRTHLKNLDLLVEEAGKLPCIDMVEELSCYGGDLKSIKNNQEATDYTPLVTYQTTENGDRNEYFKTREMQAEIASKFEVEDMLRLFSFWNTVQQWKENTKGLSHWWYAILTLLFRFSIGITLWCMVFKEYYKVYMMYHHKKQAEIECPVKFRYDIIYDQILCRFYGQPFLWFICIIVLVLLGINSVCCLVTLCHVGVKFKKRELCERKLSDFYWVLFELRNEFKCEQMDIFFNRKLTMVPKKQIETDVRSPFTKLDLTKGSSCSLPTYTLKEPVAGIPSCLFTKKIDEEDWCLEINKSLSLEDSDFEGFKHLKGLKEMKLLECHSLSCKLDLLQVDKLRIQSSFLQEPLIIRDTLPLNPPENEKIWWTPKLAHLALVDIRPSKSLSLHFMNLRELSLSEMVIHDTLQYYGERFPVLSVLSFCNCKLEETDVDIRNKELTELSITGCGIEKIPRLQCDNLRSLDLTRNNIQISYPYPYLPKLEVLILTKNCIESLDTDLFVNLNIRLNLHNPHDGLNRFDITQNPLNKDSILSDASLLFFYATERLANRLIDAEEYGDYQIENEELMFPSFKEREDARGQALFYCDIKHDQVRRRMMLYMSCAAKLLHEKEFNVCDEYQFQKSIFDIFTETSRKAIADKFREGMSFHLYLAISDKSVEKSTVLQSKGEKYISRNLYDIADVVKGNIGRHTKLYVVIDFEYGTSQDVQEQVIKLFSWATKIFHNTLKKQRSLVRETALTLKREQHDYNVDRVLFG